MTDNWANIYQSYQEALDSQNQMNNMMNNNQMSNMMNNMDNNLMFNMMNNNMNNNQMFNMMNNNMMNNNMNPMFNLLMNQANNLNNNQMFNQMDNNNQMFNQMLNQMNNLMMLNQMNNNPMFNQMNNNDNLMQLYNQINMNNQLMNKMINNNSNANEDEYMNICFSTMQGSRIMMKFKPNETVEGALKKYLLRVGLPDLVNNIDKKIIFLLSAQSLKFGDKRRLKDLVFSLGNANQIVVNDIHNLIGA